MRLLTLGLKATVVAVLVLAACTGEVSEAPPAFWYKDANVLACNPTTLRDGETLVLALGAGHGFELSIVRDADQTPYFLVVQAPPADMRILMSREAFTDAKRVELPSSIVGYKWVRDGGNEPIFTTAGSYSVYVSTALESEEGGYTCKITYVGAS